MIKLELEIIVLSEAWKIQDTNNYNTNNCKLIYNELTSNQNGSCIVHVLNKLNTNQKHFNM